MMISHRFFRIVNAPVLFLMAFFFIASGTVPPISHGGEPDLFSLLQQSAESAKHNSFQGKMVYYRFTPKDKWKAGFDVYFSSPTLYCIVFEEPETIRDHVIVRNPSGVYVTPLAESERDEFRQKTELFPWRRLVNGSETALFHCMQEVKDRELFLKNYQLRAFESHKILGRETENIDIQCRNENRPSMRVYIDKESKTQLKCKKFNHQQKIEEAVFFSSFTLDPVLPPKLFDVASLVKIISFDESVEKQIELDFAPLEVAWLPKVMGLIDETVYKGFTGITKKTVYTDGFASLSIFQRKMTDHEIEKRNEEMKEQKKDHTVIKEMTRNGSKLFFLDCNGLRISAVGDIPSKEITDTLTRMKVCKTKE